jgi:hypothetical protein
MAIKKESLVGLTDDQIKDIEECISEVLSQKEKIKKERDILKAKNQKLVNAFRAAQQSLYDYKDLEVAVEVKDVVKFNKKRNK